MLFFEAEFSFSERGISTWDVGLEQDSFCELYMSAYKSSHFNLTFYFVYH